MADEIEEVKHCNNCKRDIAVANFLMHEVHCHRNIVLCKHCDEPVPRTELEEHYEEYHAPVECTQCKQLVEKEKLDNHMENECPQRKQHCVYCELEFAQCELQNHLEFCGTRTERCSRCQRYIMLKDQLAHEQIDCMAQTTTPSPSLNPPRSGQGLNNHGREPVSSFEMEEISRMLDDSALLPPAIVGGKRTNLSRPNNLRTSQNRSGPSHLNTHNNIYGTSRRRQGQRKATNQKETTNSERDKIVTKAGIGQKSYGHNLDMDHLLAMHLHSDLNDSALGAAGSTMMENGPETVQPSPDDSILPCEFCDELLSPEELIHHQIVCNGAAAFGASPLFDLDVPTSDDLPNNSPQRPPPSSNLRAQPHIVDNLSHLASQDRLNEPSYSQLDDFDDEEIMLPCEFCNTLLPVDTLIQHQVICDRNVQGTPRAVSPHVTRNNTRAKPRGARFNPSPRVTNNLSRTTRQPVEDPFDYNHGNHNISHRMPQNNISSGQRLLRRGQYSAQSTGSSGPSSRQNFLRDVEDDAAASYSRNGKSRNERQFNNPRPPPGRMKDINKGASYRGRNGHIPTTQNNHNNRPNDHIANGAKFNGAVYRNKTRQRGFQPTSPDDGAASDLGSTSQGAQDSAYNRGRSYSGSGTTRAKRSAPRGRRHPQGEI